jgi:hypothetical protein
MTLWAGFAAVGVLLLTSVCAAEVPRAAVSLRWTAPDECPDDIQLVHAVESLLGQSLLETREQSLAIWATAQGDSAHGFAAKVSFSSPQGTEQRFLEHPSCDQLLRALAMVVALAIDPERVRAMEQARAEPAAPSVAAPIAPSPASIASASAATVRTAEPPAEDRPASALAGARLALHGLAGSGALPGFGAGMEAALGLRRRAVRVELAMRYWLPREEALNVAPSGNLRLALGTLGARACWLPLPGAWQVAACAGGNVGDLSGSGVGVQNPHQRHAFYADLAGSLGLSYTRSRLAPEGGFELSGALLRPPFGVVEDGRPVETFRPAAWGLSMFFGLAFEL